MNCGSPRQAGADFVHARGAHVRSTIDAVPTLQPIAAAQIALWLMAAPAARADDTLIEIEQRLERHGADAVNAHLLSRGGSAMSALNRKTAACQLSAVSLAVRLARGRDARALQAHGEALRAASGVCTGFVLAVAAPSEISRYCASLATWGPAQTARELRRRMTAIDADGALSANPRGQACKAAYWHELHNTRVVVRPTARAAPLK
jgi:hypothetical protein